MNIAFRVVKERWYHRVWDYFFPRKSEGILIGSIGIDVNVYSDGSFEQRAITEATQIHTVLS